jgi:mono/diheme cytochrome c family protein
LTSYLGSGQEYDPDGNLYAAACASCHYNAGPVPLPARPKLALNSALTLPEPTNFIQVVLKGISNTEGAPRLVMPAYASSLTNAEIARLAAYLRRTRTRSREQQPNGSQCLAAGAEGIRTAGSLWPFPP